MEKRNGGNSSKRATRRLGLVCLGVSLGGCLALALALACLELTRREEMNEMRARLEAFALEAADMKRALENVTKQLALERQHSSKSNRKNDNYEDEYDYYEDDSYDYDEDTDDVKEEEGPPRSGGAGNSSRRGRRSVQYNNRYQVRISKGSKHPHLVPKSVQARIYVEKSDRYEELKGTHDSFIPNESRKVNGNHIPKAIHYGGSTSHIIRGSVWPYYYAGNDKMYHHENVFKNWKPSHWVSQEAEFYMDNATGEVTIGAPGIYYVYAQIFYEEGADTCGFWIIRNGMKEFQCTVSTVTPKSERNLHINKRNSCYTGGLLQLQIGDRLWVKETEGYRYTIYEKTKSFFGMFRVTK